MRLAYGILALGLIFGCLHLYEKHEEKNLREKLTQDYRQSIQDIVAKQDVPIFSKIDTNNPYVGIKFTKYEAGDTDTLVQYLDYGDYNLTKSQSVAKHQQEFTTDVLCRSADLQNAIFLGMKHHFIYQSQGQTVADFTVTKDDCKALGIKPPKVLGLDD